jgi:flagellar hook-associated protein 2
MATLSSIGIGSGLDANAIVSQLVALERRPIEQLQTEAGKLDARLSSFGRIQSALDGLRTASRSLTDSSTWRAATATSGDSTAVGVTASSGSSPGSYAIEVSALAASQMNATSALASAGTTVGQGTLHIDVGSWSDDLSGFTPKDGSSTIDITIGPDDDTLEKIRDKINNTDGVGVRASIVNDASGSRLVLQSRTTGVENGFRVQVTDDDGTGDDDSGLSRLAYDPENGAAVTLRSQPGTNAKATINNLLVESATNTMTNIIDGVTLKLGKVTTGKVDVTVGLDSAAMRKSVDTFVSSYNDLVKLLRDQTKYDAGSKSAGTLQGDRTAIGILGQVRSAMGAGSSASGTFGRLSDIGLSLQTDGTLKVDGSTLDGAISNIGEIQKFFATASESSSSSGLAYSIQKLTSNLLGVEGPITTRQEGLRRLKAFNQDRQDSLEDRVSQTEKRLRAQYQALDTNMARLTSLQNYVSQQITNWNKS